MTGLVSGLSSGLGTSLGTTAAGSAAGQAAATTAAGTAGGQLGSAIGSAAGGAMNSGMAGDAIRMFDTGTPGMAPAGGTNAAMQGAAGNTKGGWLGTGLFGNDQYNPNPSSYQPSTGSGASQAAMPKTGAANQIPLALMLLNQLPTQTYV